MEKLPSNLGGIGFGKPTYVKYNFMKKIFLLFLFLYCYGCGTTAEENTTTEPKEAVFNISEGKKNPYLVVLGIAQDAGYPQASCKKDCCKAVWKDLSKRKMVSCLGLVNPSEGKGFIFDATPDFKNQLNILQKNHHVDLGGIFLTHGHMGHYTGLMHLGREAMGTKDVPVYAMSRMGNYLKTNGPWSQLVKLKNIALRKLEDKTAVALASEIQVTPILVPHRDEFSETVGFFMNGKNKSAVFIPDIDKWNKWDADIVEIIKTVDIALLDGTFFENGEIPGRDMSLIPHPFMEESMKLFEGLSKEDKAKIHFIHFNHTNPVLKEGSVAREEVLAKGFRIAEEGMMFDLD